MKKTASILIVGGLVFGLSACGGGGGNAGSTGSSSDRGSTSTEASGAKQIFEQSCASCHGQNLKGGIGPSLEHIGSQLSKKEILTQIKNGTPGKMPAGVIKGEKADKVATWLAGMK